MLRTVCTVCHVNVLRAVGCRVNLLRAVYYGHLCRDVIVPTWPAVYLNIFVRLFGAVRCVWSACCVQRWGVAPTGSRGMHPLCLICFVCAVVHCSALEALRIVCVHTRYTWLHRSVHRSLVLLAVPNCRCCVPCIVNIILVVV